MYAIFIKIRLLIPCSTFGVDHIESLDMRSELASLQRECGDEAAAAEMEAGILEVRGREGCGRVVEGTGGVTSLAFLQSGCVDEVTAAETEASMLEARGRTW